MKFEFEIDDNSVKDFIAREIEKEIEKQIEHMLPILIKDHIQKNMDRLEQKVQRNFNEIMEQKAGDKVQECIDKYSACTTDTHVEFVVRNLFNQTGFAKAAREKVLASIDTETLIRALKNIETGGENA